jgi:hypothetical protein
MSSTGHLERENQIIK